MNNTVKKTPVKTWLHAAVTGKRWDQIERILFSPYSYQQELVKSINAEGLDDRLPSASHYFSSQKQEIKPTIKIEGIEKLNEFFWELSSKVARGYLHKGPVTCHCFIAAAGSPSFPTHTDPDDVIIYVIAGTKLMVVNGEQIWIRAGQYIHIPANTPHRADNREMSIMLSFGLERYIQDKLNG